jgi:threonine dehydrogenase-like Zn-dependent dehydrogenase
MKALVFERDLPRFAAAKVAGSLVTGRGVRVGPLQLDDVDPPDLPGPDWVVVRPRLAGICGSDLATIDGASSRYFEPIVSFPFVPGHEVVGELDDGTRVVLEPVLGCVTRGIDPVCDACARGDLGNCERIAFGDLEPGLQTGFCCDTGGGWSTFMIAHRSQLHDVPDGLSDEAAVMVEPAACAIHAALAGHVGEDDTVAVLGAGTLGLLTVAALRRWSPPAQLLATAKHPDQKALAKVLGADTVVAPREVRRAVRRMAGTMAIGSGSDEGDVERLTGGADVVIDCVGSADSLADALAVVRPRGRVVVAGMPGQVSLDLTGLWHREIAMIGAYTYGTESLPDGTNRRTFDLAFELAAEADLGRLVSATYPLRRYRDAIEHAAAAGSRGAVKVAFDLRDEKERAQ